MIKLLEEKERKILELEMQIEEISRKSTDTQESLKDDTIEALKQSMLDIRDALTAEVADKHDTIVTLRRDVQILEEQCRKADQQTHFKDDIIKELRKELKHFKGECKYYLATKKPNPIYPVQMRNLTDVNDNLGFDINKLKCPIKTHSTIEKYKDFGNHVVIFACKDIKQREVHKTYHKDKVVYQNPKVVHEYKMNYLKRLLCPDSICDFEDPVSINSKAESSRKYCAYNLTELDKPEKLVENEPNLRQLTISSINSCCLKSEDNPRNFKVLNSYPPTRQDTQTVSQHPPPQSLGFPATIDDLTLSHYEDSHIHELLLKYDKISKLKCNCFTYNIEPQKQSEHKQSCIDDGPKKLKKKSMFTRTGCRNNVDMDQVDKPNVKAVQHIKTFAKLKESNYSSMNNSV